MILLWAGERSARRTPPSAELFHWLRLLLARTGTRGFHAYFLLVGVDSFADRQFGGDAPRSRASNWRARDKRWRPSTAKPHRNTFPPIWISYSVACNFLGDLPGPRPPLSLWAKVCSSRMCKPQWLSHPCTCEKGGFPGLAAFLRQHCVLIRICLQGSCAGLSAAQLLLSLSSSLSLSGSRTILRPGQFQS